MKHWYMSFGLGLRFESTHSAPQTMLGCRDIFEWAQQTREWCVHQDILCVPEQVCGWQQAQQLARSAAL